MTWQHRKSISLPTIRMLVILFILFGIGSRSEAAFASPRVDSANGTGTSTVLVIDTSASMDDILPTGGAKLTAAQDAGRKLLDIIGAENEAGISSRHEVAIVDFSDTAVVDVGFTTNTDTAQNALSSLYTTGLNRHA